MVKSGQRLRVILDSRYRPDAQAHSPVLIKSPHLDPPKPKRPSSPLFSTCQIGIIKHCQAPPCPPNPTHGSPIACMNQSE